MAILRSDTAPKFIQPEDLGLATSRKKRKWKWTARPGLTQIKLEEK